MKITSKTRNIYWFNIIWQNENKQISCRIALIPQNAHTFTLRFLFFYSSLLLLLLFYFILFFSFWQTQKYFSLNCSPKQFLAGSGEYIYSVFVCVWLMHSHSGNLEQLDKRAYILDNERKYRWFIYIKKLFFFLVICVYIAISNEIR